uniref:Uncharacterized protein n=1 Tax=Oryza barthii TaxID=65489 RepID=A0A0D3GLC5_9ORYZ
MEWVSYVFSCFTKMWALYMPIGQTPKKKWNVMLIMERKVKLNEKVKRSPIEDGSHYEKDLQPEDVLADECEV